MESKMKTETWKAVQGYEGIYEVGNMGHVRVKKTGKVLKPQIINSGYYMVHLYKGKKKRGLLIHRLVAEAFCEKPDQEMEVNHKNKNRLDNRAENLEWMTHKENCDYSLGDRRRSLIRRKPINASGARNIGITEYGRYRVHISVNGKVKHICCCKTLEEAIKARDAAESALWGEQNEKRTG